MSNNTKRNILLTVVGCLIMLFIFSGCSFGLERGYLDDIHVELESRQAEIIIREWQFLLGSGAEIYYKSDDEEVMLGQLAGGDDGFCPFQEGLYSVDVGENEVTIKWCIFPHDEEKPWREKTFELPSD